MHQIVYAQALARKLVQLLEEIIDENHPDAPDVVSYLETGAKLRESIAALKLGSITRADIHRLRALSEQHYAVSRTLFKQP